MPLSALSDPNAVLAAMAEYDRIGREAFLDKYSFGQARSYFVAHKGRHYDSKAIAGAAHGYEYPELGPLVAREFSGGEETVRKKLGALGFDVVSIGPNFTRPSKASFRVGSRYTRKDVAEIIGLPAHRREGGSWTTGYDEYDGAAYIFANVGVAGRTGHNYPNSWEGKHLIWFGKTNARRGQPQIDRIISNSIPVHVFWRGEDRGAFSYAGDAVAVEASDDTPVRVVWAFDGAQVGQWIKVSENTKPKWRRGPPPTAGIVTSTRVDGPTYVYVLRLEGIVREIMEVPENCAVIKVGMANDVGRRLNELNVGFPPGCSLRWRVADKRMLPDGQAAFSLEGKRREQLRVDNQWIGGEFAIVPESLVMALLK